MTIQQIRNVLDEAQRIGTISDIYFEGGEPFLFYPVMVEGVRLARSMRFDVGIVTNGYWSTSVEDAETWLRPLAQLGISNLSISDDDLHHGNGQGNPAKIALASARALGMEPSALCMSRPEAVATCDQDQEKGAPVTGGDIKLRGRAVEKFAGDLPVRRREVLNSCPYEDLQDPKRVHVDAFGNVQVCQGISMGNCWKTPLADLVRNYEARTHPICGPLIRGGPVRLVEEHRIELEGDYVDECHLCFIARKALMDQFPEYLTPPQVYGIDEPG
jgi:hypothetical protein